MKETVRYCFQAFPYFAVYCATCSLQITILSLKHLSIQQHVLCGSNITSKFFESGASEQITFSPKTKQNVRELLNDILEEGWGLSRSSIVEDKVALIKKRVAFRFAEMASNSGSLIFFECFGSTPGRIYPDFIMITIGIFQTVGSSNASVVSKSAERPMQLRNCVQNYNIITN